MKFLMACARRAERLTPGTNVQTANGGPEGAQSNTPAPLSPLSHDNRNLYPYISADTYYHPSFDTKLGWFFLHIWTNWASEYGAV